MAFERTKFDTFRTVLKTVTKGDDIHQRSIAENFILEERLTEQREDSYEVHLKNPVNKDIWIDGHEDYIERKLYIKPGEPGEPETFSNLNASNLLPDIDADQDLVRLENAGILNRWAGREISEIIEKFQEYIKNPGKIENKDIVNDILSKWNPKRDFRPIFAGFWGEVKDIFTDAAGDRLENKDWANQLRDRFGLGYLNPGSNSPIPVLVFRYKVKDLLNYYTGAVKVIAIPTVLDGQFNSFFCPTPENGWNAGQTLDLSQGEDNDYLINREIVHRKIEYKPEFLYNAGWITRPPARNLEKARKIHLDLLRDNFKNKFENRW